MYPTYARRNSAAQPLIPFSNLRDVSWAHGGHLSAGEESQRDLVSPVCSRLRPSVHDLPPEL